MNNFKKSDPSNENLDAVVKPFSVLADDWMLVTAGTGTNRNEWNTMTAAWGGFGYLWNKPVAHIYIRPTRHTLKFTEQNEFLTLAFFEPTSKNAREALKFCGTKSGADFDKAKETGLKPFMLDSNLVGFEQAKIIISCKKLYSDELMPEKFLHNELHEKVYPKKDFHIFYICEILNLYENIDEKSYNWV